MAKQQRRKPPKRKPGRPQLDDDLTELMSVLSEESLVPSVGNWFAIPWRDGWNAASLARVCYTRFAGDDGGHVDPLINVRLARWILDRDMSPTVYEQAGDAILEVSGKVSLHALTAAGLLLCSLRCVQLVVSNSSGGGATLNDVLLHRFERIPWTVYFADEVRDARCRDAIGVGAQLNNDANDRLRRAFRLAWDRGLYRVAYALPRAK